MAPNLVVATKKLFSPHKWFHTPVVNENARPERQKEHWDSPVAGTYEYVPGRGWSLVAIDKPAANLVRPIPVKYSRVLKRHLLLDDYNDRKCLAPLRSNGKVRDVGFFRLDDGVAWVNHIDQNGDFIPGPYKKFCWDKSTGNFRDMLKGDDPVWRTRQASRAPSLAPSHCSVCRTNSTHASEHRTDRKKAPMTPFATTPLNSRPASIDIQHTSHASTRSSSPLSNSRNLSLSATVATVTTAPTSPAESIRDIKELASRLEAVSH